MSSFHCLVFGGSPFHGEFKIDALMVVNLFYRGCPFLGGSTKRGFTIQVRLLRGFSSFGVFPILIFLFLFPIPLSDYPPLSGFHLSCILTFFGFASYRGLSLM